jgi:uroporphyrinogen-III synthase
MGRDSVPCGRIPPLAGWRVGLTAHRRADEQAELLRRRGAAVLHGAVVRTLPFGDDRPMRSATEDLLARPPELVIATTGIGIRSWFGAAESWGIDRELADALTPAQRLARGPKAHAALAAVGLPSHVDEPSERLDRLVDGLVAGGVDGRRIALQLYGENVPWAVERLRDAGADVVAVPIYTWTPAEDLRPARRLVEELVDGQLDAVTFTSSAAVRSFAALSEEMGVAAAVRDVFATTAVAGCIGPITGEMAEAVGFEQRCVPDRGRLGLLVRELSIHLHGRHRHLRAAGPGAERDVVERDVVERDVVERDVVVQGGSVCAGSHQVELTGTERLLFAVLAERPGAVVSRGVLRQRVWQQRCGESAVDSAVSRLRRVLQPVGLGIEAVHRRGWALGAAAADCAQRGEADPRQRSA